MLCPKCLAMGTVESDDGSSIIECPTCRGRGEVSDGGGEAPPDDLPGAMDDGATELLAGDELPPPPPPSKKKGKGSKKPAAAEPPPPPLAASGESPDDIDAQIARLQAAKAAKSRKVEEPPPPPPPEPAEETALVIIEENAVSAPAAAGLGALSVLFTKDAPVTLEAPKEEFASTLHDVSQGALLPRLDLAQAMSEVVTSGKISAGSWFRSDTQQALGPNVWFVPLGHVLQRMCFDKDDLKRLLCAAFNDPAKPDFGQKFDSSCARCKYGQWTQEGDKNVAPQCGETRTFLALVYARELLPDGTYGPMDPFVATIPHRRTQVPIARSLVNALLAQERGGSPCTCLRVAAGVESTKAKKGVYYARKYKLLPGYIQGELHAKLVALAEEWMPALRRRNAAEETKTDENTPF